MSTSARCTEVNPTCFDVQLDPVCQFRVVHSLYQSQEPTPLIGLSFILQSKVGMKNDEGSQSFKTCVNHHLLGS